MGGSEEKKEVVPRPSSSILLVSPRNEVLLLHRVRTSSAFPSAHVFPGGNISSFHEGKGGQLADEPDTTLHVDSPEYRLAAIRETFEESGILLARDGKNPTGALLDIPLSVQEEARKQVHANKVKFGDWVASVGGVPATDDLHPFTRWITPRGMPKRFSTQMYLFLLPLEEAGSSTSGSGAASAAVPGSDHRLVPTPDGGLEHTEAVFAAPQKWVDRCRGREIILFPPQLVLLDLVAKHLRPSPSLDAARLRVQRESLMEFLRRTPPDGVPWAEKVITPSFVGGMDESLKDDRMVMALSKPKGDPERVVLVRWEKRGPMEGQVAMREDVLRGKGKRQKL